MAPPRGASHTAGPDHMEAYMKFPSPDAAALAGAAQAQFDIDARRHGATCPSTDLAPLLDPSDTPLIRSGEPLHWLRFQPAATPAARHLSGSYP